MKLSVKRFADLNKETCSCARHSDSHFIRQLIYGVLASDVAGGRLKGVRASRGHLSETNLYIVSFLLQFIRKLVQICLFPGTDEHLGRPRLKSRVSTCTLVRLAANSSQHMTHQGTWTCQ